MRWFLCLLLPLTLFADDLRPNQRTLDVVIVGGGVSGLYTGWRMVESGKKDVHIFEGSDRLGGRIYTTRLAGMPNVPVEMGALQFFPSQMRISGLVNHFGLKTKPFSDSNQDNFLYLRGKRFREKDEQKDLPYDLPPEEKGKDPSALIVYSLSKIDPRLTIKNWQSLKNRVLYKSQSLYDVPIQSFILETLSPEAFQLLADLDYLPMTADVSVATALSNFLRNTGGESQRLVEGFDRLPKKLAEEFEKGGGKVNMKHHLMSISYDGEKENFRYRLLFYQADGSFKAVYAKHLVLAMTPPALKLLAQQSPALKNEQFHAHLEMLSAVPQTRLYLGYDYPWWRKMNLSSGFSVTTLPIRRCIYLESESDMPGGEKDNTRSLLCASTQDLYDAFWDSFNGGREFAPEVGQNAVWQAEKQLEILHGVRSKPDAYTASFIDWSDAPHFGAFFLWRTGSRPDEVAEYFMHPFVGEPLHVIGSAFSENQGWVEGALESADNMLKHYFLIDPPQFTQNQ